MDGFRGWVCGLMLAAALAVGTATAEDGQRPWWDDYPLIVDGNDAEAAVAAGGTAAMCNTDADPGWGLYGQVVARRPDIREAHHARGLKVVTYFETFGETYCYIAELLERGDAAWTPVACQHWGWNGYRGGPRRWIGVHNYFDDEEFARPFTRTHPVYGSPPVTYPDGRIATGYSGPMEDPRNSRVFDAACAKDVYGQLAITPSFLGAVNAKDPATGRAVGPLDGLLEFDGGYAGLLLLQRDSACPMWIDFTRASVRMAADEGVDGIWSDNYGPWDSLGYPPVSHAFGEWSVAGFRTFLADHFTDTQRTELGIGELDAFDVRTYLRAKAAEFGGVDQPAGHPVWRDARWLAEPVWLAYLIYKRQRGTQALAEYDQAVREATRDSVPAGFPVGGNDIPFYSLGWCRGTLDMVSTEMTPGWHMGAGTRGIQLPPVGRFAPIYHLAREHARARLVNVWFYMPEAHQNASGMADVVHYEMLANDTLPKLAPDDPRVAGTVESGNAFGSFVARVRPLFVGRQRKTDVGIYYSSSSVMAQLTPGGFIDFDRQPHQFAAWGVGTALTEIHVPFRFVPEWKLSAEEIASLSVLIIPNADILDPETAASVVRPWLDAGGKLITTGACGVRLPESGNFAPRPEGSCLDALTGSILRLDGNAGMDYYLAGAERRELLGRWRETWNAFAGAVPESLDDLDSVPATLGLQIYENQRAGRWYLDINNYDIDAASDTIRPTGPITVRVTLPAWVAADRASALSPDGPTTVTVESLGGGRHALTVSGVVRYVTVVVGGAPID